MSKLYDLLELIISKVNTTISTTPQYYSDAEKTHARQNLGIVGTGKDGEPGRGILKITRTDGTGDPGTVDTYTIMFTDNTISKFTIHNGADGKDGSDGVPPSGKAGQYLRKKSDADGDVEWADFEIPKEYGLVTYDQDKTITIT